MIYSAALYTAHAGNDSANGVLSETDRNVMGRYLDSNLTALIWNDYARTPIGEVGNLDFDPFYNAQDTDIREFRVGEATTTGETATVVASFRNFDQKQEIIYRLRQTPAGWRVSNVIYDDTTDLVTIMSANP